MVVRNKILFSWIIIVQFFFYFQPLLFWIISKRKLDDNRNHFGISLIVHHRNDISNINVQFFTKSFDCWERSMYILFYMENCFFSLTSSVLYMYKIIVNEEKHLPKTSASGGDFLFHLFFCKRPCILDNYLIYYQFLQTFFQIYPFLCYIFNLPALKPN